MATATKRTYGLERTLGDIIYNPNTKSVFTSINLGFFGKTTMTLVLRTEDGCYDLMVTKQNSDEIIKVGQTYPVKKNNIVVEGLTQATLGLLKTYDSEKQKELVNSSDALFITTHKLKEPKVFGTKGFKKVGYITGKFGIENEAIASLSASEAPTNITSQDEAEYDDDNEVIPF